MRRFSAVWCVDFEFHAPGGEPPRPICISAVEYWTRRHVREWLWDGAPSAPPFDLTPTTALVAYAAQAELSCFLSLGWPFPPSIIDLFAEFRVMTNGLRFPGTNGLLGALEHFGIEHNTDQARKDAMRALAVRGGPFTQQEKDDLMDYCDEDVFALVKLLPAMNGGPL